LSVDTSCDIDAVKRDTGSTQPGNPSWLERRFSEDSKVISTTSLNLLAAPCISDR